MIVSLPCGVENNVSVCVTILTWFWIVVGVMGGLLSSSSSVCADAPIATSKLPSEPEDFFPRSTTKLSVGEHQHLNRFKSQFVTRFNSKDNPGDRDTWYVIGFVDSARSETNSREATMLSGGTILWTDGNSHQQKNVKSSVIAHGRMAAAQAVLQYSNSPNAAAGNLRAPSNTSPAGWMKQQNTAVATDRRWVYRAFERESQARAFLAEVRATK